MIDCKGSRDVDRVHASDVAAQAALKRMYAGEPTVSSSQKKIQMMVSFISLQYTSHND